jgi:prepilin signal peptidase PulO-like enzyme (type II secretory pathway)
MEFLILLVVFFFGTIIGSFLNVVAYRFNTGKSLVGGRSMCFTCGKTLHWHELVPLVSYIVQNGKCKGCKARISAQYPIVEALTGFVFVCIFVHFAHLLPTNLILFAIHFVYAAIIWSLALVIAVYDIRHTIIPERLVWLMAAFAFIGSFIFLGDALVLRLPPVFDVARGVILAAPFALLWYFSGGRLMGLGDAKLVIGLAYLVSLSQGIAALILSFWIGAVVSLLLMAILKARYSMKSEIPFGPFLVFGFFVVYLTGITLFDIASIFL